MSYPCPGSLRLPELSATDNATQKRRTCPHKHRCKNLDVMCLSFTYQYWASLGESRVNLQCGRAVIACIRAPVCSAFSRQSFTLPLSCSSLLILTNFKESRLDPAFLFAFPSHTSILPELAKKRSVTFSNDDRSISVAYFGSSSTHYRMQPIL